MIIPVPIIVNASRSAGSLDVAGLVVALILSIGLVGFVFGFLDANLGNFDGVKIWHLLVPTYFLGFLIGWILSIDILWWRK